MSNALFWHFLSSWAAHYFGKEFFWHHLCVFTFHSDPDHNSVRDHQPERVCDSVMPLLSQDLHHRVSTGEECEETDDEHRVISQVYPGPGHAVRQLGHPQQCRKQLWKPRSVFLFFSYIFTFRRGKFVNTFSWRNQSLTCVEVQLFMSNILITSQG